MAKVSGLAVAETAAGFILLWSGLKNVPLRQTLMSLAAGKAPAGNPTGPPVLQVGSGSPTAPAAVSGDVATGKMLATAYGWGSGAEWDALYALWERESGWSPTAWNPGTGATGIPQLNPGSHVIPPGWSSPAVQIAWGLTYIKGRYGDPLAAWAHEQSAGWY